jgi:hypothetical protein
MISATYYDVMRTSYGALGFYRDLYKANALRYGEGGKEQKKGRTKDGGENKRENNLSLSLVFSHLGVEGTGNTQPSDKLKSVQTHPRVTKQVVAQRRGPKIKGHGVNMTYAVPQEDVMLANECAAIVEL